MKKPLTITKLKEKVWDECKRINRKKNPPICYTCGATGLCGGNWHTGHGKPNGALSLKYKFDLRNLKSQCYNCNVNLGGCSDIFISKLQREKEGLAFLKESCVKVEGRWEIKKEETMGGIQAWAYLTDLLAHYKSLYV